MAPTRSIRSSTSSRGAAARFFARKSLPWPRIACCIIADASKRVEQLGSFPLPVEIVDFGLAATLAMIDTAASDADCTGRLTLRRGPDGTPFRTDGGHLIVDCAFGEIPDPELLADMLDIIPGVVEHGLFIGIADEAFLAGPSGVTVLRADDAL